MTWARRLENMGTFPSMVLQCTPTFDGCQSWRVRSTKFQFMLPIKCFDDPGLAVYDDKPNENAVVFIFILAKKRFRTLSIQVGSAQSFSRQFPEPHAQMMPWLAALEE